MKKSIFRIVTVSLAMIMLCLGVVSCGSDDGNPAVKANYPNERYNYDLDNYIVMSEYKGVPIPLIEYKPTEEKIASTRIKKLSYFSPEYEVKDGVLEKYDIVDCDFSATIDGQPYDTLSSAANNARRSFVVGIMEHDVPEIDECLLGMAPGETKTVTFDLPVPYYRDPINSGKTVEYTVTVDKIRRQELEDYTDEFVGEYYGASNVAAYDAEIETQLINDYGNYYENYEIDFVWKYIDENAKLLKLPGKEFQEINDETINNYIAEANENGYTLEQYVTETLGYDNLSAFYDSVALFTQNAIKEEIVLYYIARCENITVSDTEYEDAVMAYAAQFEITEFEDAEYVTMEEYGSIGRFKEILKFQKVTEFLATNASKIDPVKYFEGDYVFDTAKPDTFIESLVKKVFGLFGVTVEKVTATEYLILGCALLAVVLLIVIIILVIKALVGSKKNKEKAEMIAAKEAEREEIRRVRREMKQAKKKHHRSNKEKQETTPEEVSETEAAEAEDVEEAKATTETEVTEIAETDTTETTETETTETPVSAEETLENDSDESVEN